MEEGMKAIRTELTIQAQNWKEPFSSLYLGGGTPSWIDASEFQGLIETVQSNYSFTVDAEWTLEANPDDISTENLQAWKSAGINRLSIGIQSFDEKLLKLMHRSHSVQQSEIAIERARAAGFDKFNIDLIYGIPGLDIDLWQKSIDRFLEMEINHLSAYALTVEPKTRLHQQIKKGIVKAPDDDLAAEQFLLLSQRLRASGFEHYEVSNLAKPGHQAKHNSAYWSGDPYLGIGPSAHSFRQGKRWWNVASMIPYIKGMQSGEPDFEEEHIDSKTAVNEYLMTGLRTQQGISLHTIKERFGERFAIQIERDIQELEKPFLNHQKGVYFLSPEGYLMADRIASDLMIV